MDLKHKSRKSHQNNRRCMKHKLSKEKHCSESAKKKGLKKTQKLRLGVSMASGFQGATSSLLSSTFPVIEDDDIVVVYDKHKDKDGMARSTEKGKETKFCLSKPFDVPVQDIPLPPENWIGMEKSQFVRLEDIPLPPSHNTYEKLTDETNGQLRDEADKLKELLQQFRKWEHIKDGQARQLQVIGMPDILCKPNTFTVMSYNVLAQHLLEDHEYLYRKHDTRALKWMSRCTTLWKEILEANADILCLQEVQASHLDSFYSKLKSLGYQGIFKRRSSGNADGCALYYKTDKFTLVDSATVEYFQDYFNSGCILDRNNIAIIVRLALHGINDCENQIVVATTHLLFNPRRHDVKLAQTQVLLAELDRMSYVGIDKLKRQPKYLPMIVTGDFNLQPNTAVYKLLTEGSLHYSALAAKSLTDPYFNQKCQEYLLPFDLQISSTCQHLGLLLHRTKEENSFRKIKDISHLSKLYHSDVYRSPQHYKQIQSVISHLYEEDFIGKVERGWLRHNLNLRSVYQHERQSSSSSLKTTHEATTHQNGWITVDYIFYSGSRNKPHQEFEEGPLKLLSRYSLPTVGQCSQLKSIPNLVCGSDHFSLLAHFFLDRQ